MGVLPTPIVCDRRRLASATGSSDHIVLWLLLLLLLLLLLWLLIPSAMSLLPLLPSGTLLRPSFANDFRILDELGAALILQTNQRRGEIQNEYRMNYLIGSAFVIIFIVIGLGTVTIMTTGFSKNPRRKRSPT